MIKRREIRSDFENHVNTKGSSGDEKAKEGRVMSTEVSGQWTSVSEKSFRILRIDSNQIFPTY